ncbi:amidase [Rhodococcoides corynebacterioides]|uniref:amidase n=1 Tax=Rhodococcoides corynebacterioides TaxID=53972 RepID=UPI0009EEAD50|nr:amidase [Rhodococcus corynebacterioides]
MVNGGRAASRGPSSQRIDEQVNSVVTWIDDAGSGDGPLAGVRVGVKDNIDVAGVRSTCASRFFADRVADADAEVVRRLRAAGAAVVATLNMAEFAVGVTSQNSAAGGPRNPWDTTRVPAGSSGGSGAAVAAGIVDLALGTDTGGSVRLPASACGVTGLRPSRGEISNDGVFPVSPDFDTVGPMARTVREVADAFAALACPPLARTVRRIGVPDVFITADVDPAVAEAVSTAVDDLAMLGYEIVPIEVPGAASAQDVVYTAIYHDAARIHRERLDTRPDLFQPATLERISLGLGISEADRRDAADARRRFCDGLAPLFDAVDVVLTPTMPVDVPPIDGGDDVLAQSRRMGQFTYPWSLHDGPTLAVPVGFHRVSGMPVGMQLTAPVGHEGALFGVGERYQAVTRWHTVRPEVCVPD